MSKIELTFLIAICLVVFVGVPVFVFTSGPETAPYYICSPGGIGSPRCIPTESYTTEDGCAIAANGEDRVCGNYTIRKMK